MGEETAAPQKSHRERQAGRKFDKKKARSKPQDENMTARQRNPKAFAIQSVNKMARKVRRTLDIKEKKHHIPVVDRTPLEPPPVVVAVVGPPKVGKTTLIRCLVKNFTRQNLGTINGPITIVSGKKRRLTLLECNNDINSMIDIAKIADLVLLLVDASFGFEMETFEFLNIAQVHGFPRIMGVLTHLDMMKDNKALKKTKKRLKHRFWTEVYQGAKLFYLSGMVHGDYQKREVQNLGRFISVMKFRPLVWRNMHSYVLADRMEDLTNPELIRQNSKCDRTVSLYGYVRGVPLKQKSSIHIPGCGDFAIRDVSFLSDPCPLPDKEKKRSLNEKERLIYAPMSGVGGIVYDKDVVYVELGSHKAHSQTVQEEEGPTNELVTNLIGSQKTLDTKMAASKLTLFADSNPVASEDVDSGLSFGDEDSGSTRPRRRAVNLDDDRDDDSDDEEDDDSDDSEEEEEGEDDDDDEWNIEDDNVRPVPDLSEQKANSKKRRKLDEGTVAFADSDDELEHDMKTSGDKQKDDGRKIERKHRSIVQREVDPTRTVKCDIDVLKKRKGDLSPKKWNPDSSERWPEESEDEEEDEEEESEQDLEDDGDEDDDDEDEDDEAEEAEDEGDEGESYEDDEDYEESYDDNDDDSDEDDDDDDNEEDEDDDDEFDDGDEDDGDDEDDEGDEYDGDDDSDNDDKDESDSGDEDDDESDNKVHNGGVDGGDVDDMDQCDYNIGDEGDDYDNGDDSSDGDDDDGGEDGDEEDEGGEEDQSDYNYGDEEDEFDDEHDDKDGYDYEDEGDEDDDDGGGDYNAEGDSDDEYEENADKVDGGGDDEYECEYDCNEEDAFDDEIDNDGDDKDEGGDGDGEGNDGGDNEDDSDDEVDNDEGDDEDEYNRDDEDDAFDEEDDFVKVEGVGDDGDEDDNGYYNEDDDKDDDSDESDEDEDDDDDGYENDFKDDDQDVALDDSDFDNESDIYNDDDENEYKEEGIVGYLDDLKEDEGIDNGYEEYDEDGVDEQEDRSHVDGGNDDDDCDEGDCDEDDGDNEGDYDDDDYEENGDVCDDGCDEDDEYDGDYDDDNEVHEDDGEGDYDEDNENDYDESDYDDGEEDGYEDEDNGDEEDNEIDHDGGGSDDDEDDGEGDYEDEDDDEGDYEDEGNYEDDGDSDDEGDYEDGSDDDDKIDHDDESYDDEDEFYYDHEDDGDDGGDDIDCGGGDSDSDDGDGGGSGDDEGDDDGDDGEGSYVEGEEDENGEDIGSRVYADEVDDEDASDECRKGDRDKGNYEDERCEDDKREVEKEDEDSPSGELKWKENLRERAAESFLRQQTQTPNLRKLVYGTVVEADSSDEEDTKELGGLFTLTKTKESKKKQKKGMNDIDCSSFPVEAVRDWTLDEVKCLIADCMVTGKWAEEEDAKTLLDQDDDLYGDFEDLETGEVHKAESSKSHHDDSEDDEGDDDDEDDEEEKKKSRRDMTMAEKRAEKKRKMKEMFDADYDNKGGESYFDELKEEMNQQAQLNRSEFADMEDEIRTQYEGFRSGMYVRVEIADVPCEFVTHFDPVYPIILGGLLNNEEAIGYVQMRLKKHRWYPKILKTRDPVILSVGWRRFQTIPLYSIQDHNGRNRLLKYTPEHMHCQSIIWGPITRQGTGVLAVQSVAGRQPGFRIAATGVILDLDKSMNIVKKLKLTGTPMKIHKNTAFIQGMFNTALEVVKFEGASIRTVSGIRGQIKKPLKSPPGAFRATFEDKILRSDIVFVSTWFQVAIPKLYNPVTTLLLAPEDKGNWTGMRTVGQLRHDANIPIPINSDSQYRKVERKPRRFNPLVVPRSLQKELPFKEKNKSMGKKKRVTKGATLGALRAVIREPQERKVAALMHELSTLYKERERKERKAMAVRVESHKKKMAVLEAMREQRQKKAKQEVYKLLGQMKKKNQR